MIKNCYIHIPFCSSICSYCDFSKIYYNSNLVNKYIDSLLIEINNNYHNEELDTIYIGGGTPSCLNILELTKLLDGLKILKKSKNIEYTIECNIKDIEVEKLKLFKEYGINRLSIGVESFNDNKLKYLERDYLSNDIYNKIILAKEYFTNINIDLIYAVPNEDLDILKNDLDKFIKLDIPHISIYSLIIEDNTKLKINNTKTISEELDRNMYDLIENTLTNNNYIHYEISNYAKINYLSKHNMTYWNNNKYYGFGLGASGYIDNIRYTNTKSINKYLDGNYVYSKDIITKEIDASNYAILGLRTLNGVNKKIFKDKFKCDFIDYFKVYDLLENNIILENKDSYYLNSKYWYISNEFLIRFI